MARMRRRNIFGPRQAAYQAIVLGISAAVIIGFSVLMVKLFQSAIGDPGSVTLGIASLGQVVGSAAARAPAAGDLPGLVGTPTASATATETPTPTLTLTATATETPTATLTPDVSVYDPNRAKTLLAQAQTSFAADAPAFLPNLTLAASRLNQQRLAPGATLSFNALAGPYTTISGYRTLSTGSASNLGEIQTVDGGITQVSTTLFQAAFWSGLKIVERHTHPTWLDRLDAGSTGQKGLDAYVNLTDDLRIENTTGDWIRIETTVETNNLTISIYGADPGWSVNPSVGAPTQVVQPPAAPQYLPDPSLPPGQQFVVSTPVVGFDVIVQRTVSKDGNVIDRYGVAERYTPQRQEIAIGPTPTPTPKPTPELLPTPIPITPPAASGPPPSSGPTHVAGLNPAQYTLPDGRIRTPNLVGLSEAEAQQVITALGLQTSYVNYQGPGDVSDAILKSVKVGEVLSQTPAPDTPVQRGTTVFIAVRKQ